MKDVKLRNAKLAAFGSTRHPEPVSYTHLPSIRVRMAFTQERRRTFAYTLVMLRQPSRYGTLMPKGWRTGLMKFKGMICASVAGRPCTYSHVVVASVGGILIPWSRCAG